MFDSAGIIDTEGNIGEILVGFGVWTGEQLEVTTIASSDLSSFDGPILPGYIEQNMMLLKVWDQSLQLECDVTYTASFGSGSFNNLFTNIGTPNPAFSFITLKLVSFSVSPFGSM